MKTHNNLLVYKKSLDLVDSIYKISNAFPKYEQYGLTSQIRRASVSIPSNIAEGAAKPGNKEFIKYLYISLASLNELETQLEIAVRLKYTDLNKNTFNDIIHMRRMILKLIKSIAKT